MLNAADKDGFSKREKLEGLIQRSRKPEKRAEYEADLACPPLPPSLIYLWNTFNRLSSRRSSNGFGVNPISWADIDAFVRHSKFALAPWEIETIEDLDRLFLAEISRNQSENKPPKKPQE